MVTNANSTSSTTAEGNATERQDADLEQSMMVLTRLQKVVQKKSSLVRAACAVPAALLVQEAMQAVSKQLGVSRPVNQCSDIRAINAADWSGIQR